MKKLFIITGEHSGDIHASSVVQELKSIYGDVEIEGIGGDNLKNAGVKLFSNHKKMGSVGISFKILFDHLTLGKRLVDYITKEFKPDLVLLIDYGAFNLGVSKFLKRARIKTFYYIPPQIWASRKWRINTIKKNIDKVLCIFPFEKELYDERGIETHYCGHPLVSQLPEKVNKEEFFARHDLDMNKKLVSLFPGSRVFELENLMHVFVKSAKDLQRRHPDLQFCISHAPNLSDNVFNKYLKDTDFKTIKGENHALLSISDSLILASGTVALEAAIYQTPMIIAYRGPLWLYLIVMIFKQTKFVSLPNIIMKKLIVPELLQYDANVANIVNSTEKLLYDADYRDSNIDELGKVKGLLSDRNSAKEVANVIKCEFS